MAARNSRSRSRRYITEFQQSAPLRFTGRSMAGSPNGLPRTMPRRPSTHTNGYRRAGGLFSTKYPVSRGFERQTTIASSPRHAFRRRPPWCYRYAIISSNVKSRRPRDNVMPRRSPRVASASPRPQVRGLICRPAMSEMTKRRSPENADIAARYHSLRCLPSYYRQPCRARVFVDVFVTRRPEC